MKSSSGDSDSEPGLKSQRIFKDGPGSLKITQQGGAAHARNQGRELPWWGGASGSLGLGQCSQSSASHALVNSLAFYLYLLKENLME